MQPKQTTPIVDTETYIELDLPSKGLVYPTENFLSSGKIKLRYMKGKDENIFANPAYIKQGNVMEMLLKQLCAEPTFEPLDLIMTDKIYLLIAIRIMSLGAEFEVNNFSCSSCGTIHPKTNVDLSNIDDTEQIEFPLVNNVNEYEIQLPHSKDKIKLKILDGHGQMDLIAKLKRTNNSKLFSLLTSSLIVEHPVSKRYVYGEILDYVENLSPKDTQFIRKKIVEISGITEPSIKHLCSTCGAENKISVGLDESFFFQ